MSNIWGNQLKLSIFGESHGPCVGITLSGMEAGVEIDETMLKAEMTRRAPGGAYASARKESDQVEFVCGILNGKTTGSPITVLIRNSDQKSADYDELKTWMRPSHADYPAYVKYHGNNDSRGGGHFSGRLTAPLVAAGALCEMALQKHLELTVGSHLTQLYSYTEEAWDIPDAGVLQAMHDSAIPAKNPSRVQSMLEEIKEQKDSIGGVLETAVVGLPAGLGDPFFDSLESRISSLLFSIPAVKGVFFGAGTQFASMKGSEANDAYALDGMRIVTKTNHNGGILGGISNGMPLTVSVVIKPTPSIGLLQTSVDVASMQEMEKTITGRHDPCIVLRAVPVVEAAVKIALYDAWLCEKGRDNA